LVGIGIVVGFMRWPEPQCKHGAFFNNLGKWWQVFYQ